MICCCMKTKAKTQLTEEQTFRRLARGLRRCGVSLRREPLARGHSFRVKSGDCEVSGEKMLFIDKRLPFAQQLSVLIDFCIETGVEFDPEERELLPNHVLNVLDSRRDAGLASVG